MLWRGSGRWGGWGGFESTKGLKRSRRRRVGREKVKGVGDGWRRSLVDEDKERPACIGIRRGGV